MYGKNEYIENNIYIYIYIYIKIYFIELHCLQHTFIFKIYFCQIFKFLILFPYGTFQLNVFPMDFCFLLPSHNQGHMKMFISIIFPKATIWLKFWFKTHLHVDLFFTKSTDSHKYALTRIYMYNRWTDASLQ